MCLCQSEKCNAGYSWCGACARRERGVPWLTPSQVLPTCECLLPPALLPTLANACSFLPMQMPPPAYPCECLLLPDLTSACAGQVAKHIMANTPGNVPNVSGGNADPFTSSGAYRPGAAGVGEGASVGNVDPFTSGGAYRPSYAQAPAKASLDTSSAKSNSQGSQGERHAV